MLDALSERLQSTFRRLRSHGRIGEKELDEALREVRVALLEADVNFIARVREQALGQEVLNSITPGQQVIGIVHRELVTTLGKDHAPLLKPDSGPTTILVVGTKGSGKTTLAGRLALRLKNEGHRPLLVATDFERVAASEQLQVLARSIDVPCYVEEHEAPAVDVARRALAEAKRLNATAVIVDTAGAVALDDATADALAALADAVDPTEVLIVVDAMTGQEAVTLAREFHEAIEGTGIVVTKVDSDSRGGAVLSVREVTGLPIKLITTGERSVEDITKRMRTGQFDLEDFLAQMDQVKKMGPLGGLLEMLPGASNIKKQLGGAVIDDGFFRQSEAIVRSMTLEERRHPEILNGSRRRRIARGSGTIPADVNRLLNQFKDARKLMQAMTSGKGAGGIMRMLGM